MANKEMPAWLKAIDDAVGEGVDPADIVASQQPEPPTIEAPRPAGARTLGEIVSEPPATPAPSPTTADFAQRSSIFAGLPPAVQSAIEKRLVEQLQETPEDIAKRTRGQSTVISLMQMLSGAGQALQSSAGYRPTAPGPEYFANLQKELRQRSAPDVSKSLALLKAYQDLKNGAGGFKSGSLGAGGGMIFNTNTGQYERIEPFPKPGSVMGSEETAALRNALRPAAERAGINVDTLPGEQLQKMQSYISAQAGQVGTKERFEESQENQQQRFEDKEAAVQGRFDVSQGAQNNQQREGLVQKSITNYQSDTKPLRDRLDYATSAEQMLKESEKNPIAGSAVRTMIARLSGEVGVLTDQDIARFGGSQAITERMAQSATQMITGKLTDENRRFMSELVGTMKGAIQTSLENRARLHAARMSQAIDRGGKQVITAEEAYRRLWPTFSEAAPSKTEAPKTAETKAAETKTVGGVTYEKVEGGWRRKQ